MICMTQADRIYLSEEREAAEAAAVVQQGSVPVSLTRAFDAFGMSLIKSL